MAETGNAIVFTGQGFVKEGMLEPMRDTRIGIDMLEEYREVRGAALLDLLTRGSKAELTETDKAQEATFLRGAYDFRLAHPECFSEVGDTHIANEALADIADFTLGQSLGEMTALYAAGVVSYRDGLRLVGRRGELMQALILDARRRDITTVMSAIRKVTDSAAIEEACDAFNLKIDDGDKDRNSYVSVANYNSSSQVVLGGTEDGVSFVEDVAAGLSAKCTRLQVPAAFHTRIFLPMRAELERYIRSQLNFRDPVIPVVHNYDALPSREASLTLDRVSLQPASPVRFTQSIQLLGEKGVDTVHVYGPGAIGVGNFFKMTDTDMAVVASE